MRVMFRGFQDGRQMFEEEVDLLDRNLSWYVRLAEGHTKHLDMDRPHMIEIEFLDEPDPQQRFFRFGSDRSRMVAPVALVIDD
jgi:hypothetical protein